MLAADPTRDRYTVFNDLTARLPAAGSSSVLVGRYSALCHETIVGLLGSGVTGDLLDLLHANGLVLHLSSGTPQDALIAMMEETGLGRHFASIHGAPGAKSEKLETIMTQHRLEAGELAVIGDGDSDRDAAHAVSCRFLRVNADAGELYGVPAEQGYAFLARKLDLATCGAAA